MDIRKMIVLGMLGGGAVQQPSFLDDFSRADGDIENGWTANGTAAIYLESAKLTPTVGNELHTSANAASDPNGNEANATTGFFQTDATISSEATIKAVGDYSIKGVKADATHYKVRYDLTAVLNRWIRVTFKARNSDMGELDSPPMFKDWVMVYPPSSRYIYQETFRDYLATGRITSAVYARMFWYVNSDTQAVYVDNLSIKAITFNECLLSRPYSGANFNCYGRINLLEDTQGGVFVNVDDPTNPQNGVFAYTNGRLLFLEKLVAGVWTPLLGTSVVYSHLYNRKFELRKNGTTYQVFYDNVQYGTDQTIEGMTGTYCGILASAPEVTCKEFYIGAYNASPVSDTRINAAAALTIPTYDGAGQSTHPSVRYVAAGWNGYKYWMAMTPYPSSDNTKENPSIVVSNDGTTWIAPVGITNPISGLPDEDTFFSDPELFFSVDGVTLYCLYRWSDGSTTGKLYLRSSTNGTTWSAASEVWSGANNDLVSPAVVWDGTQWVMWTVNVGVYPYTIEKRVSADLASWGAPSTCTMTDINAQKDFWHLSVTLTGGVYEMFICGMKPGGLTLGELFYASSADGDAWVMSPNLVMSLGVAGAWDSGKLYRASALPLGSNQYDLFYSATKLPATWRIGRTTYTKP